LRKPEEEAIRRQHAANPIRERPAGVIDRQSFVAILDLMSRFKAVPEILPEPARRHFTHFLTTGALSYTEPKHSRAPFGNSAIACPPTRISSSTFSQCFGS
jgi:hypothetical protein